MTYVILTILFQFIHHEWRKTELKAKKEETKNW